MVRCPRDIDPARLVFVGGLHRSGTTLLARLLTSHPDVSGLSRTGVWQDEGQHLQDVYRPAAAFGGPGRFAFSDGAHLTEASPLVSQDARDRLLDAWTPYWDTSRSLLLEKSPPNLLRFRFLRAVFPGSRMIAVIRHPVPVTYSTQRYYGRWRPRRPTVRSLVEHWVTAYDMFEDDRPHLADVIAVRYEDLARDPGDVLRRVGAELGLSRSFPDPSAEVERDRGERYFAAWRRYLGRPVAGAVRRRRARELEERVAHHGYSLFEG